MSFQFHQAEQPWPMGSLQTYEFWDGSQYYLRQVAPEGPTEICIDKITMICMQWYTFDSIYNPQYNKI